MKSPDKRKTWRHWSMTSPKTSYLTQSCTLGPPSHLLASRPPSYQLQDRSEHRGAEKGRKDKPSKDSLSEGTQQRRGTNQTFKNASFHFFMFCWNFLLFAEADGVELDHGLLLGGWLLSRGAADAGGSDISLTGLPAAAAPTGQIGKNSQMDVSLYSCQCTRVCFTGKNNQPNRKSKPQGWRGRVKISRCAALWMLRRFVTRREALNGSLFYFSVKTNTSFAFTPCELIA